MGSREMVSSRFCGVQIYNWLTDRCLGFQSLDAVPFRAGIPRSWTSDLEKFEAPDPAEWCPRGYAIVNIDPRGVFDSEGDIAVFGTQVR